jgi:hypothetical protein
MSAPTRTGPGQKRNRPQGLAADAGRISLTLTKTGYVFPEHGPGRQVLLERWTRELARIKRLAIETADPRHAEACKRLLKGIARACLTEVVSE